MTDLNEQRTSIQETMLRVLGRIAPEADFSTLDPGENLREQLDIDSFDFLRYVIGLHEALGVDIPETDYTELTTLDDAVAYLLAARHPGAGPP